MSQKAKKHIWTFIRCGLGFSLSGLLLYKIISSSKIDLAKEFSRINITWFIIAILLYGVAVFVSFFRWQKLLEVLDVKLNTKTVIKLGMVGQFFNTVIPGAVSGDLIKMFYIAKEAPDKRTESFFTIMVDRIIGLYGLFIVAVFGCFFIWGFLFEDESNFIQIAIFIVISLFICFCAGLIAVLAKDQFLKISFIKSLVDKIAVYLPARIVQILSRVVKAIDLYKSSKRILFQAILMSIVVHSFNGFTLIALSNAVSENTVSKHYYFFTIQISNTSGIIPVFPGGVGLRDVITQKILSSAKVDKINATMIPICFTLVFTFWSFIGALFFIFGKLKKPEDENTGENVIEE